MKGETTLWAVLGIGAFGIIYFAVKYLIATLESVGRMM